MSRPPIITRKFVNDALRRNGIADPDKLSPWKRFEAGMRIILKAKPKPWKEIVKKK